MGKNFERERQLGLGIGYEGSFLATPFLEHSQPHLNVKDSRYLIVYHTTMGKTLNPKPLGGLQETGRMQGLRVSGLLGIVIGIRVIYTLYLDPQSM